jgi:hypothetical protein
MFVCLVAGVLLCIAAPAFATMLEAKRDAPVYGQNWQEIATIAKGTKVELIAARDTWYKIRYTNARGQTIEGWSRSVYYRRLPDVVEALRDTPVLDEQRREVAILKEGERAVLVEVEAIHCRIKQELPDGNTIEGRVRKGDLIDARAADFAREVRDVLEGFVQVRRAAGFEQRRTKTFGKEKIVVQIVSRTETVWLEITLASKVAVRGVQVHYQIFKEVSDSRGRSQVVEARKGVLGTRGAVEARPVKLSTQFSKFEWEDQIVSPENPAVSKNVPDLRVGEYYHGYRVEVYWHGFLLALYEENAPPVQQS